jgi:hypothetical protein
MAFAKLALIGLAATPSILRAQDLPIPKIPADLPREDRSELEPARSALIARVDSLNVKIVALRARCNPDALKAKPEDAPACVQELEVLTPQDRAVKEAKKQFRARLESAVAAAIAVLQQREQSQTTQIAETQEQLRNLGFKRTAAELTGLQGQSEAAQRQLVSGLISRVRDYAVSASVDVMQTRFLERIASMKPREVSKLADALQRAGVSDPLFLEWLRSFSPNASRQVLVRGAELAIHAVESQQDLFSAAEGLSEGTLRSRQEAAVTLIGMVTRDFPGLRELTLVATGAYDVIEAGVMIAVLDRSIDGLTQTTEVQLVQQKRIICRLTTLMFDRDTVREQIKRLSGTAVDTGAGVRDARASDYCRSRGA